MIMTLDRSFSLLVFLVLLLDRVSGWGWAKKNRNGYVELKEWVDGEERWRMSRKKFHQFVCALLLRKWYF